MINEDSPNASETGNHIEDSLAQHFTKNEEPVIVTANDYSSAFVDVPVEESPSKSRYYPAMTSIQVKSLETIDIKNYSKMDANNSISIEKHIDQAMDKNIRIIFPSGRGSFKDLTQSDRIHFLFLLREATMRNWKSKKELVQIVKHPSNPSIEKKVVIDHTIFEYYDIPKGIEKYYSDELRCYHIFDDSEKPVIDIKIHIPTIGTINWIKNKLREFETKKYQGEEVHYDENFYKHLQFLVPDWRLLDDEFIKSKQEWYDNLSIEENEVLIDVIDKITIGIKPTFKVKFDDGEEVIVPLRFRDYKSIFSLSDRASKLLSDTE